ncbi:hypothetical protein E6Q11_00375 [Candidatus Dojkabacteria bacterium]|uniref:GIY-YIG domain-containing protein n=1 Tax=Candidatus Dojkabacteria bacterium TaxID=2099670 RepID=A0A5C7JB99_9BACT|nr:MAG: hypothetical protein E6Q11_00375 [Candidatus Dojkabacteria bacterium]
MATSGIYQIINTVSNKSYVGLSVNIEKRKCKHLHLLRNNRHPNIFLQNAWNKYGELNFLFKVLERCSPEELFKREHYWVKTLNCLDPQHGYNLKETSPFGKNLLSSEHVQKLIDSRKNLDFSKIHTLNKGKKVLNTVTQELYPSLKEAAIAVNMNKGALSRLLSGKRKNHTNLIYMN